MLSGEKFQKSLIIFPRNWELFYSSLKFVVSDLASDQNTLRAGAPPSSLLLVLTTFATSSIEHDDYRVEREDWRWRREETAGCRLPGWKKTTRGLEVVAGPGDSSGLKANTGAAPVAAGLLTS